MIRVYLVDDHEVVRRGLRDQLVAARIRQRLSPDATARWNGHESLSDVEGQVLALVIDGDTDSDIVQRTGLTIETVQRTVAGLLAKLGVGRATGLTDLGRALIST